MPTILRIRGYRFFFYMNEHLPVHIHVTKGDGEARIILEPDIELDQAHEFKPTELKQILAIVQENREYLISKWHETFDR